MFVWSDFLNLNFPLFHCVCFFLSWVALRRRSGNQPTFVRNIFCRFENMESSRGCVVLSVHKKIPLSNWKTNPPDRKKPKEKTTKKVKRNKISSLFFLLRLSVVLCWNQFFPYDFYTIVYDTKNRCAGRIDRSTFLKTPSLYEKRSVVMECPRRLWAAELRPRQRLRQSWIGRNTNAVPVP